MLPKCTVRDEPLSVQQEARRLWRSDLIILTQHASRRRNVVRPVLFAHTHHARHRWTVARTDTRQTSAAVIDGGWCIAYMEEQIDQVRSRRRHPRITSSGPRRDPLRQTLRRRLQEAGSWHKGAVSLCIISTEPSPRISCRMAVVTVSPQDRLVVEALPVFTGEP